MLIISSTVYSYSSPWFRPLPKRCPIYFIFHKIKEKAKQLSGLQSCVIHRMVKYSVNPLLPQQPLQAYCLRTFFNSSNTVRSTIELALIFSAISFVLQLVFCCMETQYILREKLRRISATSSSSSTIYSDEVGSCSVSGHSLLPSVWCDCFLHV